MGMTKGVGGQCEDKLDALLAALYVFIDDHLVVSLAGNRRINRHERRDGPRPPPACVR